MDIISDGKLYRITSSDLPKIREEGLDFIKSSTMRAGDGFRETEFSFPDLDSFLDWADQLVKNKARVRGLPLWRVHITGNYGDMPKLLTNPVRYPPYSVTPTFEPFVVEANNLLLYVPESLGE